MSHEDWQERERMLLFNKVLADIAIKVGIEAPKETVHRMRARASYPAGVSDSMLLILAMIERLAERPQQ